MLTKDDRSPIGLLAAGGRLPLAFAAGARTAGVPVVCVGLKHMASPELVSLADRFHWVAMGRMTRAIRCFQREGVRRLVVAGKVFKGDIIYRPWMLLSLIPDLRTIRWYYRCKDRQDDTLMLALIREFASEGLTVEAPFDLCPELLVRPGVLTRRRPSAAEERDVAYGWRLAKKMGELDVGQSVAVKEGTAIAVEAIEGTDRCIRRAGELCRAGGFVVVKVAKPQQDMRFDVPTVGTDTVRSVHEAGGKVLAIEADRTIILDQPETIALANRLGVTLVALHAPAAVASSPPGARR